MLFASDKSANVALGVDADFGTSCDLIAPIGSVNDESGGVLLVGGGDCCNSVTEVGDVVAARIAASSRRIELFLR